MAEQSTLYDLVLMLSNGTPPEQRERILSLVQSAIQTAGGSVERDDDWGRRPMAYEIRHQAEAEYHLLQFHAPGDAIEELSHTLHITDGVLRFRIIKVRRGTPEAKSTPPPVVAAVAASSPAAAAAASAEAPSTPAPAPDSAPQPDSAPAPDLAPEPDSAPEPGDSAAPDATGAETADGAGSEDE